MDFDHQHLLRSGFRQTRIVEIDFQVGLLTTIGLSAKNAILIVQFADEAEKRSRHAQEEPSP